MSVPKVTSYTACVTTVLLAVMFSVAVEGQLSSPGRQRQVRDLLYVTANGTTYVAPHHLGVGILVFDVANDFKFVKRIPTWDVPVSQKPELVVGIGASVTTGLLYVTVPSRIAAFDLTTDKKVWEQTYDGQCCEMIAVSPDGETLYLNSFYKSHMYAVDAKTGALKTKVEYSPSFEGKRVERAHNINWSPDGSKVFMSGSGPDDNYITVADPKTHSMVKAIGPFGESVRQFTTNGTGTMLFSNTVGLCGFDVADVLIGEVLGRVECPGDWKAKIMADPDFPLGHGAPSHGIAMSADETEIWVADGVNSSLHVFDATVTPPRFKTSVKTRVQPYTLSFSLDDRYVFSASGDVVDAKTKKVVAVLKDEYGRDVYSEKFIQATFGDDGKMLRANQRFSKGQVGVPAN
jgi:DNA-binding beta-propeller fold protein YncE